MPAIMPKKDFKELKAQADGNCLFRSIIQSLLVQGFVKDEKAWVVKFINDLIQRTEKELELNGMEIKPGYSNRTFQDNEIREGSKLKLSAPKKLNNFIEQYNNLSIQQLALFSNNFFLKKNEPVLYYLSACLRRDILSHHTEANNNNDKLLNDFNHLHAYADVNDCTEYLKKHKINVLLYTKSDSRINSQLILNDSYSALIVSPEEKTSPDDYKIDTHLIFRSEHYNVLLPVNELQPKLSEALTKKPHIEENRTPDKKYQIKDEVAFSKQLQIEESKTLEDVTLAKNLQIKEIEYFAKKFKFSGNKNNQSFISDVIKGLRLDKELDAEQLNHLYALQNSTTIEKLVESLQSVINDLGYSSQFKEQINNHSFFPSCKQEKVDTIQTLSTTPAIKCH